MKRYPRTLVVGLGRSGRAAVRFLLARGCEVSGTDIAPLEALGPEAAALASAGVRLTLGEHRSADLEAVEQVVISPGVPHELPLVQTALARGIPVVSELELVADEIGSRVIAITGSNGKTTTTGIVEAMLRAAGRDAIACGNFGTPLVEAVAGDNGQRWYALEISSFQLLATYSLRAAAVILLNIQADHIDRHGSFENYRDAKFRIAELRAEGAPIVLVIDDMELATFARRVAGPLLRVSTRVRVAPGGYVGERELLLALGGQEIVLAELGALQLPGRHNRANLLAAGAACSAAGVSIEALRRAAQAFKPLPHRLQEVVRARGVRFVDDSKGTNVGSVVQAIEAMRETMTAEGRLFVLLGGRDKDSDFRPLALALQAEGSIAITFGEAGTKIAMALAEAGLAAPTRATTMEHAIECATAQAKSGDVILLSPACASFDAFNNYAHRGDSFAAHARRLAEANA